MPKKNKKRIKNEWALYVPEDKKRDQSYFLFSINESQFFYKKSHFEKKLLLNKHLEENQINQNVEFLLFFHENPQAKTTFLLLCHKK